MLTCVLALAMLGTPWPTSTPGLPLCTPIVQPTTTSRIPTRIIPTIDPAAYWTKTPTPGPGTPSVTPVTTVSLEPTYTITPTPSRTPTLQPTPAGSISIYGMSGGGSGSCVKVPGGYDCTFSGTKAGADYNESGVLFSVTSVLQSETWYFRVAHNATDRHWIAKSGQGTHYGGTSCFGYKAPPHAGAFTWTQTTDAFAKTPNTQLSTVFCGSSASYTYAGTITIRRYPITGTNTPTATITPTATVTPTPTAIVQTCTMPDGGGIDPPGYVPGFCQTLLNEAMLEIPALSWIPTDWEVPAAIGVPGVRFCTQYLTFTGSLFGMEISNLVTTGVFIFALALVVNEFRS